ncbi:hypothetical protein HHK36_017324 [Tetracentron sinense]|uniref:Photosystem II 5 kDa protein, chloroplastic n=1 Tax=Tetracentron sinense TaxID=13715 RepID=A0A834Z2A5_TETSI|nr:hypothetical protein HHK36_017324 [Tetracentron sinense]
MASITMTASFLGGINVSERPSTATRRRSILVAKAAAKAGEVNCKNDSKKESSSSGRRDMMFAAAAAALCSVAGVAMADQPKAGTPEARKIYAPICVTMPTARICHK